VQGVYHKMFPNACWVVSRCWSSVSGAPLSFPVRAAHIDSEPLPVGARAGALTVALVRTHIKKPVTAARGMGPASGRKTTSSASGGKTTTPPKASKTSKVKSAPSKIVAAITKSAAKKVRPAATAKTTTSTKRSAASVATSAEASSMKPKKVTASSKVAPKAASSSQTSKPSVKTDGHMIQNTEIWDRNTGIHARWIAAQVELEKARKRKNAERIRKAEIAVEAIGSEFFVANRGLAISVAKAFLAAGEHNADDYVNAASLGLWEAFRKWDPTKGVTFGTFSRQYIKGRLVRTVRSAEFGHISQTDFNRRKEVRETQVKLAEKFDRAPSHEEIAQHLGITTAAVTRALSQREASLDVPVGDGERTLGDYVADDSDHFESFDIEVSSSVDRLLDELNELELWLVIARGELLGTPEQSLLQIADEIGVGREIARRAEAKAKARLVHTKLTMIMGRLPSDAELAAELKVPTDKARSLLHPTWSDLHDRWLRAGEALSDARRLRDYPAAERRRARLDRIGEEVLLQGADLIAEAAISYADGEAPIGPERSSDGLWEAFRAWNPTTDPQFPAWARRHWAQQYRRIPRRVLAAAVNDTTTANDIADAVNLLWSRVRRSGVELPRADRTMTTA
jgi:RNA polymerase sigma factor (sigma-70 family)